MGPQRRLSLGWGSWDACSGGGILRKINRDAELSADLLLLGLSL